jgi:hypothetical protein
VKLGVGERTSDRVTAGPLGWVHRKVSAAPSGSEEPEPSRRTVAPVGTVWSAPASATGGRLPLAPVTLTDRVSVRLKEAASVTVSSKTRVTPPVLGV